MEKKEIGENTIPSPETRSSEPEKMEEDKQLDNNSTQPSPGKILMISCEYLYSIFYLSLVFASFCFI